MLFDRDLKSFLVNASGGMYAGVAATVNVNLIEGATDAKISNAILNGGIARQRQQGRCQCSCR